MFQASTHNLVACEWVAPFPPPSVQISFRLIFHSGNNASNTISRSQYRRTELAFSRQIDNKYRSATTFSVQRKKKISASSSFFTFTAFDYIIERCFIVVNVSWS